MHRRKFLHRASLGTAAALLAPLLGVGRARAAEAAPLWAELLEYARWSPSPHNVQPWKLQVVSATEARLYYDPARLLPHTDPTSRFTVAGLGMFIECLRLAALTRGLALSAQQAAEPRLSYSATGLQLFATLHLAPTTTPAALDRELIRQRKTSRLHYDNREIPLAVQHRLSAIAATYGHTLTFTNEPAMVSFILDLNRETLFTDLDDPAVRTELASWVRTSDQQAATQKDGLWSHCMGFPGRLMHNFFFHSERFRSAWKRRILGKVYTHSMHGTTTVAWLQGPFGTRPDWVQAGALLQQLWLEMTRHNLYLHPFGSVITNPAAYTKFSQRIGQAPATEPAWLLVRLGYSQEPPRSYRLTVNDILLHA
ncbi:hypothetical protein [Hymenobacter cellulosilyticus]|uniref:Nitroreductase domain-containing protein n=1 Tax=Hymenobacter cellulosilyticus TaxID=2932248 RepID=A0A8T9QB63_9BACT|nr:hypothetical protein [Hymenobacter cellulosilyticus]UOQ74747.1 hypothetical protein MUN79_13230 [Hymenobacter cellulosilyticus]